MIVVLAILVAGLAGAALLWLFTAVLSPATAASGVDEPQTAADTVMADAAEPVVAENWLVQRAARIPAVRALLTRADRRLVGGAAIVVCFVALFLTALFVGWIFSSIDSSRGFARWDESVAAWGPDHATSTTASVMKMITRLGTTYALLTAMVVIGVIDRLRSRSATSLWFLLTVGVGVTLVNNGLKLMIMRERPPVEHLVGAAGSSFPSGHSASAAACWMAIALVVGRWVPRRVRPWLAVVAASIAVLVAASRALLGVHWVTDVVAGLTVGWTWFFVVAIVFGGRLQRLGEPAERIATASAEPADRLEGARHDI